MTAVMRIASGKILTVSTGQIPQLYIGLDAGKPSPGPGDYYIATDTGKNYTCYVDGIWSLILSPTIEEYSNHLGTVDNIMSLVTTGNATGTTNAANHRLDLSTGINVIGYVRYNSARLINPTTENFIFNAKIQNLVMDGGGSGTPYGLIGLKEAGDPSSGKQVAFEWTGINTWYASNYDLAASSLLLSSNPVSGDTLTIVGNKLRIFYLVNGVLVSTSLANIPNTNLVPCFALGASNAIDSSARQISCDYIKWTVMK